MFIIYVISCVYLLMSFISFIYGILEEVFPYDSNVDFMDASFKYVNDFRFIPKMIILLCLYNIKLFNIIGNYVIKILSYLTVRS